MLNDPEIDKLIIYALAGMVAVLTLALIVVSVKKNTYYVDEEGHEIDPRRVKGKKKEEAVETVEPVAPVVQEPVQVEPIQPIPVTPQPEEISLDDIPMAEAEVEPATPTVYNPQVDVTVIVNGHMASHSITNFPCLIGRESMCDLVVSEPAVSRKHARFVKEGNTIYLEDVSGHNGTFLNQTKIEPMGKAAISSGDSVHLGRAEIRIDQIR